MILLAGSEGEGTLKIFALLALAVFLSGAPAAVAQSAAEETASTAAGLYVVSSYDEARDPAADLVVAMDSASAEIKRILLEVGGFCCLWCHDLEKFIA